MEETNEAHKGLMDKTAEELTVADNLKLTAIVIAGITVIPLALSLAVGVGAGLWENRKAKKAQKEHDQMNNIIEANVV